MEILLRKLPQRTLCAPAVAPDYQTTHLRGWPSWELAGPPPRRTTPTLKLADRILRHQRRPPPRQPPRPAQLRHHWLPVPRIIGTVSGQEGPRTPRPPLPPPPPLPVAWAIKRSLLPIRLSHPLTNPPHCLPQAPAHHRRRKTQQRYVEALKRIIYYYYLFIFYTRSAVQAQKKVTAYFWLCAAEIYIMYIACITHVTPLRLKGVKRPSNTNSIQFN